MALGSYTEMPGLKVWNKHRDWGYGPTEEEYFAIYVFWSYAADLEKNSYTIRIDKVRFQQTSYKQLGGCSSTNKGGFSDSNLQSGTVAVDQTYGPPCYCDVSMNPICEFVNDADGNPQNVRIGWAVNVSGNDRDVPRYTTLQYTDITSYLPKMARGSKMTLPAGGFSIGTAGTISVTSYNSSFTHRIYYSVNETDWVKIHEGNSSSVSYTFPESFASSNMQTTTSLRTAFKIETLSSGSVIATSVSYANVTLPDSYKPSIDSAYRIEDQATATMDLGVFVQQYSNLALNATGCTITKSLSAPIVKYTAFMQDPNGTWWQKGSGTSPVIDMGVVKNKGTMTTKLVVTDARGRTAERTRDITVEAYASPKLTLFTVDRCSYDEEAQEYVANSSGFNAWFSCNVNCSVLGGKNSLRLQIDYATVNSSNAYVWQSKKWKYDLNIVAGTAFTNQVLDNNGTAFGFSADRTYIIRATLYDVITSTNTSIQLTSSETLLNFGAGGKSIGFGGLSSDRGTLEFYSPLELYAPRSGFSGRGSEQISGYLQAVRFTFNSSAQSTPITVRYRDNLTTQPLELNFRIINGGSFTESSVNSLICSGTKEQDIYLYRAAAVEGSHMVWDLYFRKKSGSSLYHQIDEIIYDRNVMKDLEITFPYTVTESLPFTYDASDTTMAKAVPEWFPRSGASSALTISPTTSTSSGRYSGQVQAITIPATGWYWFTGAFGGSVNSGTSTSGEVRCYVETSEDSSFVGSATCYGYQDYSFCRAVGLKHCVAGYVVYLKADVPTSGMQINARLYWDLIHAD